MPFSWCSLGHCNVNNPLCYFHSSPSPSMVFDPGLSSPYWAVIITDFQDSGFSICCFFFDDAGVIFLVQATSCLRLSLLLCHPSCGREIWLYTANYSYLLIKWAAGERKQNGFQPEHPSRIVRELDKSLLTSAGFEPFKAIVVFHSV